MERQIALNQLKCLQCEEILISHSRYDYKVCGCCNETMIDGGTDYLRYGGKDLSKIDLQTVFTNDDYELVRVSAERGSRGEDGNQPLTYIKLCDMSLEHLNSVKAYGGSKWHIDLIKKEIKYRKINYETY
jgi:hypothetical protein